MEPSSVHQAEQNEPGGDLAQRIWSRYGQSPGVVSQVAIGRLLNHVSQLSQDRLPLLAKIQRRWRPGADNTAHAWPALPYAHLPVVAGTFATPVPQTHAETVMHRFDSPVQQTAALPPATGASVVQKAQHPSAPPAGTTPGVASAPVPLSQHGSPPVPGTAASPAMSPEIDVPLASTRVQRHQGDSAVGRLPADTHTLTMLAHTMLAPPQTPAVATNEPVPEIPVSPEPSGATGQLAGGGDSLGGQIVQRHLSGPVARALPDAMATRMSLAHGQPASPQLPAASTHVPAAGTEISPGPSGAGVQHTVVDRPERSYNLGGQIVQRHLSGSAARALPGGASQFTLVARTLLSHTPSLQTSMTTMMPGIRLPTLLSQANHVQRLAVVPSTNSTPTSDTATDAARPEISDRPAMMLANIALATDPIQQAAVAPPPAALQTPITDQNAAGSVPSDRSVAMPSHSVLADQIHVPVVTIQRTAAVQAGGSSAPLSARSMPWAANGSELPLAHATVPEAGPGMAARALLFRTHDTSDTHFALPLAMPTHSPATTTLQTRSEPGSATLSPLPTMETSPATETPAQPAENNADGLDIDTIADTVLRKLTRQLAVERERRGVQPWP